MKLVDIQLEKRSAVGKGAARSARRVGKIPGILYGEKKEAIPISVDRRILEKTFKASGEGENVLVNVVMEGEEDKTLALVREAQHHPVTGTVIHCDFLRVSADRPIITTVPVHTTGSAKGVREGGILELMLRDIQIQCLPLDIPDHLEVDVSHLGIGHALHVSDLPKDPRYTILTAPELALVVVAAPKIEVAHAAQVMAEEGEAKEGEAEGAGEKAE
ncbi:MAG TPA: 50S ribosomal protein L25 [bacterium]|nr:50S ribosomal protein L25 [Candidatus Omnitrophota bacterium]HOJ60392.1 50S ribosomal protein L25 [bacterium]HOL94978.1 50S ribosomal protein L25 [bacterium]HPP02530.1 50S ribosomal protein L25 [bacterium]HXK94498.1 50S ribosomal protein L25 [bacterium]